MTARPERSPFIRRAGRDGAALRRRSATPRAPSRPWDRGSRWAPPSKRPEDEQAGEHGALRAVDARRPDAAPPPHGRGNPPLRGLAVRRVAGWRRCRPTWRRRSGSGFIRWRRRPRASRSRPRRRWRCRPNPTDVRQVGTGDQRPPALTDIVVHIDRGVSFNPCALGDHLGATTGLGVGEPGVCPVQVDFSSGRRVSATPSSANTSPSAVRPVSVPPSSSVENPSRRLWASGPSGTFRQLRSTMHLTSVNPEVSLTETCRTIGRRCGVALIAAIRASAR